VTSKLSSDKIIFDMLINFSLITPARQCYQPILNYTKSKKFNQISLCIACSFSQSTQYTCGMSEFSVNGCHQWGKREKYVNHQGSNSAASHHKFNTSNISHFSCTHI
jgi:hypothetical protein